MDLSFSRTLDIKALGGNAGRLERTAPLPILLAATAAQQAGSPTCRALASILRGQEGESDRVQALAHLFAPRQNGVIDAECLAGSFHSGVAAQWANLTTVGTVI